MTPCPVSSQRLHTNGLITHWFLQPVSRKGFSSRPKLVRDMAWHGMAWHGMMACSIDDNWGGRVLTSVAYIQSKSGNAGSNPVASSWAWSRGLRRQNLNSPLRELARLALQSRTSCARLPDWWSRPRPHEGSVQHTVAGANSAAPTTSGRSSIAEHGSNCFANLRGRLIPNRYHSHGSSIAACPVSSQRLRTNWA